MKIHLICSGNKMPAWIKAGYEEYSKRLPRECALILLETKHIVPKIPAKNHIVALDEQGELWDTRALSLHVKNWQMSGKNISLVIGGADGHDPAFLKQAHQCWSLSRLTFPHLLVRILVAEQLYRAYTLLSGHPYHRK